MQCLFPFVKELEFHVFLISVPHLSDSESSVCVCSLVIS